MESRDAPIKLRRVKRLDCIALDADDRTYFTEEGYLVDHPILTGVGIFEYTNPDGSIRRELRLPQNVFDEKSLKTYRGKPVIITHDAGVVNKDNVDKEQIGTILSDGYQDGENVRAEIIIHDTDAMKDCGLKELSLGYNLDLIEEPGEWNGMKYDAIQTNIVINHLALVANARAGEKARLNIDGSDEPTLKGGKATMNENGLSPEEMQKAIDLYKASKAMFGENTDADEDKPIEQPTDGEPTKAEPTVEEASEPATEEVETDGEFPPKKEDAPAEPKAETPAKEVPAKEAPAEEPKAEGGDLNAQVIAVLEKVIADLKGGAPKTDECDTKCDEAEDVTVGKPVGNPDDEPLEPDKEDSADDKSESMNMDSADDMVKARLSICRVGDKLHMDGLEAMSIMDGKKAIITKVNPNIRLDGKDSSYINAMYDICVEEATKRKGVDYQRQQMMGMIARADGSDDTMTMAESARMRMMQREGGNE